ncbi:hypothetical protein ACFYSH_27835 [Streptomyces sp. NPDC005791]|uniref:hypothetical protein n=1 Tax=unclassified Streptomyces TaxID=2593676 RepID=UPI0033F6BA20
MPSPQFPPLPALTRAEADFIDCYLAALDQLGRINPARGTDTYGALRAAQALASRAVSLRDALVSMHERGESQIHADTLARALRLLDGERRAGRVAVPPAPSS